MVFLSQNWSGGWCSHTKGSVPLVIISSICSVLLMVRHDVTAAELNPFNSQHKDWHRWHKSSMDHLISIGEICLTTCSGSYYKTVHLFVVFSPFPVSKPPSASLLPGKILCDVKGGDLEAVSSLFLRYTVCLIFNVLFPPITGSWFLPEHVYSTSLL